MNQKNTTWPYRPFNWGPLFLAPCPPKNWRFCCFETLTFNNSTASGSIFMQSFSCGSPEPNELEKHKLATQTLHLGSDFPCAMPPEALGVFSGYETLTLNNAILGSLIFKESFPGGSPEHNEPEKHNFVTQTLSLGSVVPCTVPPEALAILPLRDFFKKFWIKANYIQRFEISQKLFNNIWI